MTYNKNTSLIDICNCIGGKDMKKKITTKPIPEETNIKPLDILVKEFIKGAIVNNLNKKGAIEKVKENWNDIYFELFPLPEETSEEKEFRKKAIIFWDKNKRDVIQFINSKLEFSLNRKRNQRLSEILMEIDYDFQAYEEFSQIYARVNSSVDPSTFIIEIFCAIYKSFEGLDSIYINDIAKIASERINRIYYDLTNKNREVSMIIIRWLMDYWYSKGMSKDTLEFINEYSCSNETEKFVCYIVYEIKNC